MNALIFIAFCALSISASAAFNLSLAPFTLKLVGVKDFRPEAPHSDRFHISFAPPKIQSIVFRPQTLVGASHWRWNRIVHATDGSGGP